MNWLRKSSSFRYSGTPVTRVTLTAHTPLGVFKCYEAISGKVFLESPFNNRNMGAFGLIPDPENEFLMHPRIECENLREAVSKANEIFKERVAKINSYCNQIIA